ncbi:tyrosine-type recombinase/integrase [Lysinibacter sp. HNR]|uniref:tyrosine-type recombinase/integrase n=1 Tax=Lysinibacter sp. HNR TaxID=3031408 RepID=UPI0024360945|nr:tyrosine-type recombinase/integrase [Lysinibacter sp. HNR]WGD38512.1 tyrosine-type recombinase/integrase [Lysinibacter sp. HNR]
MAWAEKLPSGKYRGGYRTPGGKRKFTSERFSKKAEAERAAAALEDASRKPGWRDPKLGFITWGEWYAEWQKARVIENNTVANEQSMIDTWIMPHWENKPLAEIRRHDVQVWANVIRETNRNFNPDGTLNEKNPKYPATSSVRRYLNVFVSSLSAAVHAELIDSNPALNIKLPPMPPARKVFLTHSQYAAIAGHIESSADRAVTDWLVGTGARWGEMAGMHEALFNPETSLARLSETWDGTEIKPYTKGVRERDVPVLEWVLEYHTPSNLKTCGERHRTGECPGPLMFPSKSGKPRDDRNFTRDVWKPAVQAAGLQELGPTLNDLRHTYASWLIQAGVPIERVSELLGHASLQTTQIYAHLKPVELSDVQDALPVPTEIVPPVRLAPVTELRPHRASQ